MAGCELLKPSVSKSKGEDNQYLYTTVATRTAGSKQKDSYP